MIMMDDEMALRPFENSNVARAEPREQFRRSVPTSLGI
jgi:hypothetical protein